MSSNEIIYSKGGNPLMINSGKVFAITTKSTKKTNEEPKDTFSVNEEEFVCWNSDNRFPDFADRIINTTGVLSTAIGLKARFSFGQGVIAMTADGYDGNGNPILSPYENDDVRNFLNSYVFRNYLSKGFRDIFKFGNCFPIFYFNQDASKIVQVIIRNARHCRISKDKKALCVYPNFNESTPSSSEDAEIISMLDEDDPFFDLTKKKASGALNGKPIAFPRIKNYYSSNDYYGTPDWMSAYESGWVEIAHKIPKFLSRSYANAMTLMWHIQIPDSFWDAQFPKDKYDTDEDRKNAMEEFVSKLEDSLCGEENVSKALITNMTMGMSGKVEEEWKIDRLKNEIDAKERLTTSAAANSEILFSMMLNPAILGAGMPGGAYAGNAGSGSDIREASLVSIITTYIEKQQLLDPIYMMLAYNGYAENLVLKYRDTILTTLNTGQSQKDITT